MAKEYTISKKSFGASSRRGDGTFKYASPLLVKERTLNSNYNIIYLYNSVGNELWACDLNGGSFQLIQSEFYPNRFRCDYVNNIFVWSNDSTGNGTYGGINAVYMVKYDRNTGLFIHNPIQIVEASSSTISLLWFDHANYTLYYNQGVSLKRGNYNGFKGIVQIERMCTPVSGLSDCWSPSDNSILYIAQNGTGAIATVATEKEGTPPKYTVVNPYYDNSEDYTDVFGDESNDLLIFSGSTLGNIRIATLSNPVDMTVLSTKTAPFSSFFVDSINKHIYISQYGSDALYRYEYATRSLVDATQLVDYTAETPTSHFDQMTLG